MMIPQLDLSQLHRSDKKAVVLLSRSSDLIDGTRNEILDSGTSGFTARVAGGIKSPARVASARGRGKSATVLIKHCLSRFLTTATGII